MQRQNKLETKPKASARGNLANKQLLQRNVAPVWQCLVPLCPSVPSFYPDVVQMRIGHQITQL